MFTGIVERVSKVDSIQRNSQGMRIKVEFNSSDERINRGDSIAVNGVCLTVTEIDGAVLTFDVMNQSLANTNLIELTNQSIVNLERAMAANGRFGGHYVSGHIDFCTKLLTVTDDGFAKRLTFKLAPGYQKYCISKGSICIDGISLTLTKVYEDHAEVAIIPHTQTATNLRNLQVGSLVNVEVDMVGKYLERLISSNDERITSRISSSFLSENGFE